MSSRDEEIKVKVTGADTAERDLDKLGDAAKDVGESVTVMGKESDRAAKKVDELGDEAVQTVSQLSRLDRQIAETRIELRKLNDEYERTGDKEVLKNLQAQQTALAKLETTARQVDKVNRSFAAEAVKSTRFVDEHDKSISRLSATLQRFTGAGFTGLAESLKSLSGLSDVGGPLGTGALIAGGAAAAVPALAAGGGAILGAGALGAVGGGVAGAAMGMRGGEISAAFNESLGDLKERFLDATLSWVDPTLDAIGVVDKAVEGIPLESVFRDAEAYLPKLTNGLAGFLSGIGNGVDDLVREAGPVVDKLEEKLPSLGNDVGDSLRVIGNGAPGAAEALGDVLDLVGNLTKAFAGAAAGAGALYEKAINFPVLKQGHEFFQYLTDFEDLPMGAGKALDAVAESTRGTARGFGTALAEAARYRAEIGTLTDQLTWNRNAALGLADANIAVAQGWLDLKKGLDEGAKTLALNTQAGIDNVKVIRDQIGAAAAQRDQTIQTSDQSIEAINAANAAYNESIERIRAMAYAAGFNKEKVDALIKSLTTMPPATSTEVKLPGLAAGLEQGISLGNALNRIDGQTYSARVNVSVSAPAGISLGNLLHHAAGGTALTSGYKVVGEQGPEIAWMPRGTEFSTAQQTRSILGGSGGGSGSTGGGRGGGSQWSIVVARGADSYVGRLVQGLFDDGLVQVFDGNGQPVTTRRG